MKKILVFILVLVMAGSLCACGGGSSSGSDDTFKVGIILVGDENEGYSASHYNAAKEMQKELGLSDDQLLVKTNIPENEACYDAAVDLAEQGCKIIIGNSFGFEDYLIQAAGEYPDIQFCHSTGFKAKSSGLPNMHNFFYSIYEARYVSGVVAGLKLNEMIEKGEIKPEEAKIGYIGAFPYEEVKSGFTSFFLGARSVCESATMEVGYTYDWASPEKEQEQAKQLIGDHCVLISQHADTTGGPSVCETQKVFCVGYNIDMIPTAPNYALTSAAINWAPYYTLACKSAMNGEEIPVDWCEGYEKEGVFITPLNEKAVAPGTQEKVDETIAGIKSGDIKVFDTTKFTVDGKSLEDLILAKDERLQPIADLVYDNAFHESDVAGGHNSAPAFCLTIDGITENLDK